MAPLTLSGRLLHRGSLISGEVTVQDGRIAEVRPREGIGGPIVAPGFIDLQVNGGFGYEVTDGAIAPIAQRLPATGVTAWLPTVITSPPDIYRNVFGALQDAPQGGAQPLGLHLEGPALSPRRPGAHPPQHLAPPDSALLRALAGAPEVRLMTLAPERAGAIRLIKRLAERGVVVALGHTDATFDEMEAGVDAGATMATHLFNAMSPFTHRAPGATGAALIDDRLTVGLIADGIHVHPAVLELVLRVKGPDRIALVTDMVAAAGMPNGRYLLGGEPVERRDAAVRRPDGALAGSVLTMDEAVRTMAAWTSATIPGVLRMASEVPARILGMSTKGVIEQGADADLVLLDNDLRVLRTMIGGEWTSPPGGV